MHGPAKRGSACVLSREQQGDRLLLHRNPQRVRGMASSNMKPVLDGDGSAGQATGERDVFDFFFPVIFEDKNSKANNRLLRFITLAFTTQRTKSVQIITGEKPSRLMWMRNVCAQKIGRKHLFSGNSVISCKENQ